MKDFRAPGAEIWLFKKKNMDCSIDLAVQHMSLYLFAVLPFCLFFLFVFFSFLSSCIFVFLSCCPVVSLSHFPVDMSFEGLFYSMPWWQYPFQQFNIRQCCLQCLRMTNETNSSSFPESCWSWNSEKKASMNIILLLRQISSIKGASNNPGGIKYPVSTKASA